MMQQRNEEQSLGELFASLARDTSTLVRQEVELAKTEMTEKATTAARQSAYIGIGGAIAYVGLIVLAFALVYLLGIWIPLWGAALIVALVFAGVGYMLIQKGLTTLRNTNFKPEQTIESLKEDAEWVKDQVK
jgi:fatty acid desaturase